MSRDTLHLRGRHQYGYMLVELMITSVLTLIVVGGMLSLFVSLQKTHRDRGQILDAQQSARVAIEQMRRDLHATGVGLAWVLPPVPLVVPRADGGVDLLSNTTGLASALSSDMGSASAPIQVLSSDGFAVNDAIAVYDANGAVDFVTVTAVDTGTDTITHTGATRAYVTADGAAVSRVRTTSYWVEDQFGVQTLVRGIDGGAGQAIAIGVTGLTFRYFDDGIPAAEFIPTTTAQRLRIKAVGVEIDLHTMAPDVLSPQAAVHLETRVSPRAIVLS